MERKGYSYQLVKLGESVRKTRNERGLSQRQLADMVGSDHGNISLLENGKDSNPGLKKLAKIAEALDVELKDLF